MAFQHQAGTAMECLSVSQAVYTLHIITHKLISAQIKNHCQSEFQNNKPAAKHVFHFNVRVSRRRLFHGGLLAQKLDIFDARPS